MHGLRLTSAFSKCEIGTNQMLCYFMCMQTSFNWSGIQWSWVDEMGFCFAILLRFLEVQWFFVLFCASVAAAYFWYPIAFLLGCPSLLTGVFSSERFARENYHFIGVPPVCGALFDFPGWSGCRWMWYMNILSYTCEVWIRFNFHEIDCDTKIIQRSRCRDRYFRGRYGDSLSWDWVLEMWYEVNMEQLLSKMRGMVWVRDIIWDWQRGHCLRGMGFVRVVIILVIIPVS